MAFVAHQSQSLLGAERDDSEGPSLSSHAQEVLAKLSEGSPLAEQLQAMSKDLGFRDRELVKVAGVSRATLARWRKEGDSERPAGLDDLRVIAIQLIASGALRPSSVAGWLRSRNLGLDWRRPLEILADGDFAPVLSAAEAACGARIPVTKIPKAVARERGMSFSSVHPGGADPPPEVAS